MDIDSFVDLIKRNLVNEKIIGKEKYTNSAVLIPLVIIDNELHILFEIRNKNIRQGGEVCFPGGVYDYVDGNYEETAIRETIEEIGINRDNIRIIGKLGTLIAAMGVSIDAYIGLLDITSINELIINHEEVERVFTVPINQLIDLEPDIYTVYVEVQPYQIDEKGEKEIFLPSEALGLPEKYHKPWGRRKHKIYFYQIDEKVIWGITGELIAEFIKVIKTE